MKLFARSPWKPGWMRSLFRWLPTPRRRRYVFHYVLTQPPYPMTFGSLEVELAKLDVHAIQRVERQLRERYSANVATLSITRLDP